MAKSAATTVQQYLDELPDDRRAVLSAVRETILRHLPAGYQETMNWGMISYEIPLARYPNTYNRQPLSYVGLAAQKNYYALYLSNVYGNPEQAARMKAAFTQAGKQLDMGKSCLRFRSLADVPWDAIGEIVASATPDDYIRQYEAAQQQRERA